MSKDAIYYKNKRREDSILLEEMRSIEREEDKLAYIEFKKLVPHDE